MIQSVFTYATGKKYLSLAFTLARSYKFHNDELIIPFYIVSTKNFKLPLDLEWVKKSIVNSNFVGVGLEFKLKLNELAPTYESIFIDSDSIIYDNIAHLFKKLATNSLCVIGTNVTDGKWANENIESCCKEFGISKMIRYCGAIYLIKKDNLSKKVFTEANRLYNSGRNFQGHRHNINEEPIISISISKFNIDPIEDDGNIWGDLVQFKKGQQISVFKRLTLSNTLSFKYKFWLPLGDYHPLILHMGSGVFNKNPWLFDSVRLKLHYKCGLNVRFSELVVNNIVIPIYFSLKYLKKYFEKKN